MHWKELLYENFLAKIYAQNSFEMVLLLDYIRQSIAERIPWIELYNMNLMEKALL